MVRTSLTQSVYFASWLCPVLYQVFLVRHFTWHSISFERLVVNFLEEPGNPPILPLVSLTTYVPRPPQSLESRKEHRQCWGEVIPTPCICKSSRLNPATPKILQSGTCEEEDPSNLAPTSAGVPRPNSCTKLHTVHLGSFDEPWCADHCYHCPTRLCLSGAPGS